MIRRAIAIHASPIVEAVIVEGSAGTGTSLSMHQ
jgi:hypothetical protein